MSKYVLIAATAIIVILRFVLPVHGVNHDDIFKDVAHLFVGGLFGAWLLGRNSYEAKTEDTAVICLVLGVLASGFELLAALLR